MPRQHGRGRSRSPKRVTDWVSRAIIKMGRYEDKRPVGFHVDAEGSFMLSNLMCTWVRGRNLTEEIILTEILANRRDGVIRFSVKQEAGDYRIWVHEARRSMRLGREPAQVLSYVAFLMEQGAVELDHGWASLTNIVETMKRKRFIAAVGDADALQELILKTDYDGRFTIHDGWIREIDEKDRPVAQNYCRPPHWPRAPQETPEIDEKDRAVAQNIYAAPQETPWRISARAPKNPPGKHWTRYDHGNGLFWWYYEGPKGTWWMDEREHAEPEPYPVDPVEEISSEDA